MSEPEETHGFDELLDRIRQVARDVERVRLDAILEAMGKDWFGSVLLLAGVVTLVPLIGDIPGVPTTMGVLVFLTAGQLLLGRTRLRVPRWLGEREVRAERVGKGVEWLRPGARFVDRLVKPRLSPLAGTGARRGVAVLCLVVAAAMPLMEMIPFSANLAGVILTILGIASVARDGLLTLLALLVLGGGLGFAFHLL